MYLCGARAPRGAPKMSGNGKGLLTIGIMNIYDDLIQKFGIKGLLMIYRLNCGGIWI